MLGMDNKLSLGYAEEADTLAQKGAAEQCQELEIFNLGLNFKLSLPTVPSFKSIY